MSKLNIMCMATRFINIDRQSPMLMPPDLRDWLPANHIARFIVALVEPFDLSSFKVNRRGSGDAQYPPSMLAALLIYCYATGRFSSRRIEEATYSDVAVRFISADTHPDHDTICTFRRVNGRAFRELFVKVLAVAGQSGLVKQVGGISVDGSKIKANASKHSAVSYKRAGKLIEQLTLDGRTVADLESKMDPPPPAEDASTLDKVKHRMNTAEGRALYKLRKQTVEPVFGIIKHALGFRQFHLRGHPKVDLEWNLVCLAYNVRRLFKLSDCDSLPQNVPVLAANG